MVNASGADGSPQKTRRGTVRASLVDELHQRLDCFESKLDRILRALEKQPTVSVAQAAACDQSHLEATPSTKPPTSSASPLTGGTIDTETEFFELSDSVSDGACSERTVVSMDYECNFAPFARPPSDDVKECISDCEEPAADESMVPIHIPQQELAPIVSTFDPTAQHGLAMTASLNPVDSHPTLSSAELEIKIEENRLKLLRCHFAVKALPYLVEFFGRWRWALANKVVPSVVAAALESTPSFGTLPEDGLSELDEELTWLRDVTFRCWCRFAAVGLLPNLVVGGSYIPRSGDIHHADFEKCVQPLGIVSSEGYYRSCSECDVALCDPCLGCKVHEYFSCANCHSRIAPSRRTMVESH